MNMEAQIQEMTRLRRHLKGVLQDWNKRLLAAPNGEPARLLESLPRSLPKTSRSLEPRTSRFERRGATDPSR
jgi:hypothetical protein